MVEMRLVQTEAQFSAHNPFHQHQRRRGGRMGALFRAVFVDHLTQQITYDDTVQLAAWTTSNSGHSVKFWLDELASTHPFAGFIKRTAKQPGSMFTMVLAEIPEDPVADTEEDGPKRRRLSAQAHLIVTSALFVQYLTERPPRVLPIAGDPTPESVRAWVKRRLGIESLSDLDHLEDRAEAFHRYIRRPFLEWQGKHDHQ